MVRSVSLMILALAASSAACAPLYGTPARSYMLTPAPLPAADVTGRWDNVMMLPPGARVHVLLMDGTRVDGEIVAASSGAVKLAAAAGEVELAADRVARVDRAAASDRIGRGLSGAAHGAGAVGLLGLLAGHTDPESPAVAAAVRAVLQGDRSAFETIVRLYQRRLFGLALMMTRDASGADDVAQDAFVRAFVHLDSYDVRRPFYPWISTITVRTAQNWLVRRGRTQSREGRDLESAADAAAADPDPLNALIADETDRALWRAVSGLPSGERTAVILHYRQGMSVGDIASALGVTTGTVKTQLFRARKTLRMTLDGILAEGNAR